MCVWPKWLLTLNLSLKITFSVMNSFICPLSDIGRHPREDGSVPVSSSTQCCSGLVSSIYLKVVQAHTHTLGERGRETQRVQEPRESGVQASDLQDAAHLHAQQWALWSLHHCPCSTRWVGIMSATKCGAACHYLQAEQDGGWINNAADALFFPLPEDCSSVRSTGVQT